MPPPPPVGKGTISVAFVRPSVRLSVCPSVAYMANNLRTQRQACQNLEGRFFTLDATRKPVSRSNGQRSGLEAAGGIPCRPNPAATLHICAILTVTYRLLDYVYSCFVCLFVCLFCVSTVLLVYRRVHCVNLAIWLLYVNKFT